MRKYLKFKGHRISWSDLYSIYNFIQITNEALTTACSQNLGDEDLSILFTSIKQILEMK